MLNISKYNLDIKSKKKILFGLFFFIITLIIKKEAAKHYLKDAILFKL